MIKKAFLITTLSLGFSGFAQADFIEGDWLAEGDAQATLDTRTGQEWLNLSHTVGMSLDEVTLALENELSGWHLAGIDDVLNLVYSQLEITGTTDKFWSDTRIDPMHAEDSISSLSFIGHPNSESAKGFSDAFGGEATANYSNYASYGTYGMFVNEYKNRVGNFSSQHTNDLNDGFYVSTLDQNHTFPTNGRDNYAWWLVSEGGASLSSISNPEINTPSSNFVDASNTSASVSDVSTPLSLGAFAFALMGFAGLRRKNS